VNLLSCFMVSSSWLMFARIIPLSVSGGRDHFQADCTVRKVGGVSRRLFRGDPDQGQERKARGQDGDRYRDLGHPESDRPAQLVLVAFMGVGIPLGHVGPQSIDRRSCSPVSLSAAVAYSACFVFMSTLSTAISFASSWFVGSVMFPSHPIAGAFSSPRAVARVVKPVRVPPVAGAWGVHARGHLSWIMLLREASGCPVRNGSPMPVGGGHFRGFCQLSFIIDIPLLPQK